jgi:dihydroorotate dehydrogenase electron transfer subunit
MPPCQQKVSILWNKEIGPRLYRLGFETPTMAAGATPGCFVMVRVPGDGAPLLRRPFSVHGLIDGRRNPAGLEILYRVVGPGTARLAECTGGGTLDVLGPLGRGFRMAGPSDSVVIVGGGMGVAPLVFLARSIVSHRGDAGPVTAFIGAGCEAEVIGAGTFRELGIDTVITTDDGSCGLHCLVTQPLEEYLEEHRPGVVYACGPTAMLRCVARLAAARGIHCQVSVETMMACGMGACLGCALESADSGGYLHACSDGPVFDAARVKL